MMAHEEKKHSQVGSRQEQQMSPYETKDSLTLQQASLTKQNMRQSD